MKFFLACVLLASTTAYVDASCDCMHITFLLDASRFVTPREFENNEEVIEDIMHEIDHDRKNQYSIVTIDNDAHVQKIGKDKSVIFTFYEAIGRMLDLANDYPNNREDKADLDDALEEAKDIFEDSGEGCKKVAMLWTNAFVDDQDKLREAAQELKDSCATLIINMFSESDDKDLLQEVADKFFEVEDSGSIGGQEFNRLVNYVNDDLCLSEGDPICNCYHVTFILDISRSVTFNDFDNNEEVIEDIIHQIDPNRNENNEYAIVTFDDDAYEESGFTTFSDVISKLLVLAQNYTKDPKDRDQKADLEDALDKAKDIFKDDKNKNDCKNVAMVWTDSYFEQDEWKDIQKEADDLKKEATLIINMFQESDDEDLLRAIADKLFEIGPTSSIGGPEFKRLVDYVKYQLCCKAGQ